jgi:Asp-tRNA(Asn)/Glu-tRNA(Gln) amidotransferase A subunit family amidase
VIPIAHSQDTVGPHARTVADAAAVLSAINAFGLPVGISFMGMAFSEPKLIKLASGFENAARARTVPQLRASLPTDTPAHRGSAKSKNTAGPNRTLQTFGRL